MIERVVYVDAEKPPPKIEIVKEYVPQPPKVIKKVVEVMGPTPEPEVIIKDKYIEKTPEVVEKIIYVQKPPEEPEVVIKKVQELLPQETVHEEVEKIMNYETVKLQSKMHGDLKVQRHECRDFDEGSATKNVAEQFICLDCGNIVVP